LASRAMTTSEAVVMLDAMVLDVDVDDNSGRVQFVLAPQ
jgi:hypothetical protein